jgi:hypothetical protein
VRALPAECWRKAPEVWEDEDPDIITPFEQAWKDFANQHRIWSAFERADRLARIGRYSILLLGFGDGRELSRPLGARMLGPDRMLYLTPYSEQYAEIRQLVSDGQSVDFGKPEIYRLDLSRGMNATRMNLPVKILDVHYSRVIHIVEDAWDDEVYGMPVLQAIYNRLDDLEKVAGGSAEMFWLGALRGIVASLRDNFKLSAADKEALAEEIDEYVHGLRRWISAQGMDVTALPSTVVSPLEHVSALLDLICATVQIPKRILLGSERGELASSQDERNWAQRIMARQTTFAEPVILRPTIDRLIRHGVLPEPANEYQVEWPDLLAQSDQEKMVVAKDAATALATFFGPGQAGLYVKPDAFVETFMGMPVDVMERTVVEEPLPEEEGVPAEDAA